MYRKKSLSEFSCWFRGEGAVSVELGACRMVYEKGDGEKVKREIDQGCGLEGRVFARWEGTY
jgi:hypothetical protein